MNNAQVFEGQSFDKKFNLSAAVAATCNIGAVLSADGSEVAMVWYKGPADITITDFNNLPKGSVIFDYVSATKKIYVKTGAAGSSGTVSATIA